jgi:hypothetical protein
MKRTTFFLLTGGIQFFLAAGMILTPVMVAEVFGLAISPEALFLLRCMGSMLLSLGVLNFLVRNEGDSNGLKSVLIINILYHAVSTIIDTHAAAIGVLTFVRIIPSYAIHLFVGIGSYIFLSKMKNL